MSEFSELPVRTQNVLRLEGIVAWEHLAQFTRNEVLRMPNMGKKSLSLIQEGLEARGLHFEDYNPVVARAYPTQFERIRDDIKESLVKVNRSIEQLEQTRRSLERLMIDHYTVHEKT